LGYIDLVSKKTNKKRGKKKNGPCLWMKKTQMN
jgi:hypothetical protein